MIPDMTLARAAVPVLLLAAACGDIDKFNVTRSATVDIPAGPPTPPVPTTLPIPLPIDRSALEDEGIDPDDVDSARLIALRLEVTQGTSLEAWLDEVTFYIEGPGLPKRLLAQRTGIGDLPAGTNAVDLEVSGVDLKPYVLADTSIVTADVTASPPDQETILRVTATVRVDVSVSGLFN